MQYITVINPPRPATPAENQHLADALRQTVLADYPVSDEFTQRFLSGTIRQGVIYDLEQVIYHSNRDTSGTRVLVTDAQLDARDALVERFFGLAWPRAARSEFLAS